uniref:Uncharacterized protein n=1 Tax=Xenopus tropicalis TaxID=8364 RepID=A0A1B8XYI0_XENTR
MAAIPRSQNQRHGVRCVSEPLTQWAPLAQRQYSLANELSNMAAIPRSQNQRHGVRCVSEPLTQWAPLAQRQYSLANELSNMAAIPRSQNQRHGVRCVSEPLTQWATFAQSFPHLLHRRLGTPRDTAEQQGKMESSCRFLPQASSVFNSADFIQANSAQTRVNTYSYRLALCLAATPPAEKLNSLKLPLDCAFV